MFPDKPQEPYQNKQSRHISESEKDQNKFFEDVMKSIKRKKQDDYEEETSLKKGVKPIYP